MKCKNSWSFGPITFVSAPAPKPATTPPLTPLFNCCSLLPCIMGKGWVDRYGKRVLVEYARRHFQHIPLWECSSLSTHSPWVRKREIRDGWQPSVREMHIPGDQLFCVALCYISIYFYSFVGCVWLFQRMSPFISDLQEATPAAYIFNVKPFIEHVFVPNNFF